jgi:hypothetical protein
MRSLTQLVSFATAFVCSRNTSISFFANKIPKLVEKKKKTGGLKDIRVFLGFWFRERSSQDKKEKLVPQLLRHVANASSRDKKK